MSETPAYPQVVVDPGGTEEATYDDGRHVLAKYQRQPYRRIGKVYAQQMSHDFVVYKSDGTEENGVSGDYLAGPDESGDYFVIAQADFEAQWEPDI